MKKVLLTFAIILGLSFSSFSVERGGLFQRGPETEENSKGGLPGLPNHGENGDVDAPIGGPLMLIGFGVAYAMYKRNKK